MGSASNYVCTDCGCVAECVTADFDYGFTGDVVTPLLCATDGIASARTGLNAMKVESGADATRSSRMFPCPVCDAMSPRWDRKTCPECGHKTMIVDPSSGEILWD
ncbi:MAG TPA: hypothetical protein VF299_10040 [Mycobacterium sp.]